MAFSGLRNSTLANTVLIVVCLVLAALLLMIGIGELVHPDVPQRYYGQNTAICLGLCAAAVILIGVAIAVFRGMRLSRRPPAGLGQR